MKLKLDHSQNWSELAKKTNWSVAKMAKLCRVSSRTLERFFLENMGSSPKAWLLEQRQREASRLMQEDNMSIKETAIRLGYKRSQHFSSEFKRYWGVCPTKFVPNMSKSEKSRVFV